MKGNDKKSGDNIRNDAEMALEKFFAETEHGFEWAQARNGTWGVTVTYADFLSEAMAMRMLAELVPKGVRVVLKRVYSDKVIASLLLKEYKRNFVGVVDCPNGSLTTEPIRNFVHRKLAAVELVS